MGKVFAFLISVTFAMSVWGQDARPEILVLGTYHMANPGRDIFNMKADDVLSPKRQAEVEQEIEALKKFHPTKIAVEAEVGSEHVPKQYADYLQGKYTLTRNEVDQIGFRLAKELGHKTIYPVDVEGDFPWQHVVNYANANGKSQELDAITARLGAMVKQQDEYLRSHTVLETLEFMNSDEHVRRDVGFYYADARFGDPDDYAGPDLLAAWFQRNIRIYNNITKLVDSPNERILVIYGAGHLGWLRQDVANDETLRLRKLSEFAVQ
jgi:hypothetical protein